MSTNYGKWRFEKKPFLVSLMFGIIIFLILLMVSNLEFVKDSSRTFEGADSLFWIIIASLGLAVACYWVSICAADYVSHCSDKSEGKKFVRKTCFRYFLPIALICIASLVICGIYGINTLGEVIILAMIYFVLTFPKFVNKHLQKE